MPLSDPVSEPVSHPFSASATCAALAATLLLGACTGAPRPPGERESPAAAPRWSELALPARTAPREQHVEVADALSASADLPAIVGGTTTQPGEPSRATVWTPTGGRPGVGDAWDLVEGDTPVDSGVTLLAADASTTYAAGYVREAGRIRPFLRSSGDRRRWTDVDLPAVMTERRLLLEALVVPPGSDPLVFALDGDRPIAVDLGGEEAERLPWRPGDTAVDVVGAARRDSVVLVLVEAVRAGRTVTTALRSTDDGDTWRTAPAPPGPQARVSGIGAAFGQFVVTGSTTRGSDTSLAAWSTTDGGSWTREDLPDVDGTRLTAPAALGTSTVVGVQGGTLYSQVLRRDGAGTWSSAGAAEQWVASDTTVHVAGGTDEEVLVARAWNGRAQLGLLDDRGAWEATATIGGGAPVEEWRRPLPDHGGGPVLVGQRTEVEVTDLGGQVAWTQRPVLTLLRADGTARVRVAQPDPPGAADLVDVHHVSSQEGDTVLLGERPSAAFTGRRPTPTREDFGDPDAVDVVGWFRAAGRTGWMPATGLAGPRTEEVDVVRHLGGTWVAAGSTRGSADVDRDRVAAVWTSRDGRAWRRERVRLSAGPDRTSVLTAACRLPDGDLLALGSTESAARTSMPLVLRRAGGTWSAVAVPRAARDLRELDGCVEVGDRLLLQGSDAAGRSRVLSTDDGRRLMPVTVGGEDDAVGWIQVVAGDGEAPLLAATGYQQQGDLDCPVVWLSRDAEQWRAVPVPADRDLSPVSVLGWEGGLLVALQGPGGPAVMLLENPAELAGAD